MGQKKGKHPMSHREKMEIIKKQAEEKRLQSNAAFKNQPRSQGNAAWQDGSFVKRKVVFMPYSAAMWDCMETIWRAARADSSCETYVVPIPYREKDSTGKINRESYDGEKFPAGVDIVSYKHFSLERERPDIVYIHNPYDGGNFITSVHPAYYSYNLKRYTRLLVYVPYFSGNSIPESHLRLPVYAHMDFMVVFSDYMKEQMMESVPDDKLLVAASPKEERMHWLEEHREEITLPDTWRERIGSKKVVFLNTSISSILTYGIRSLKKMEDVFRSFSKQSETILIWRPHPLMRATLISMRPGLLERYDRLEAEFTDKQIGILDKTADANITVAISDAYIGEASSSIVNLFQSVGKPIFYTGIYPYYHWKSEEFRSVSFRDAYMEGDHIWFITDQNALLCRMERSDGMITVIEHIADEQQDSTGRYSEITKIGEKIYMMPHLASGICVYDLETAHVRKYYMRDSRPLGFLHMIAHGQYLFLTPQQYPSLVRFDTERKEFAYYGTEVDWSQYTEQLWSDDESLLMLHRDGSGLLRFWLTTCEIQILPHTDDTIPKEALQWREAVQAFEKGDGTIMGCTDERMEQTVKNGTRHTANTADRGRDYSLKKENKQAAYAGYLVCGSSVLAFPHQYGEIKEWNMTTGDISVSSLNQAFDEYKNKPYYDKGEDFVFVKPIKKRDAHTDLVVQTGSCSSDEATEGGFIAFSTRRENTLYYRESKNTPVRKTPCKLSEETAVAYFKQFGENEWTESDEVSVEQFLMYLKYRESKPQPASPVIGATKGAGQEIHEMIVTYL
jgi:hypothetical protein